MMAITKTKKGVDCCVGPEVSGLETYCRPRFFPGQLLTEEDLNRLDAYVVGKNRLHNRHLHDAGVVCGLTVVCDPCGEGVRVRPGYAINECGDDIVVPKENLVDVCDLIQKCKMKDPDPCDPTKPHSVGRKDDCGGEEHWVLAVCYQEVPTRGTSALRNPEPTRSRGCECGCGTSPCSCEPSSHGVGSAGACCGGGTSSKANGAGGYRRTNSLEAAQSKTSTLHCENSIICEGYRFCVYRYRQTTVSFDDEERYSTGDAGDTELGKRIQCCINRYFDLLLGFAAAVREIEGGAGTSAEARIVDLLRTFITTLRELLQSHNFSDCRTLRALAELDCVTITRENAGRVLLRIFLLWLEGLKSCLCSAAFRLCECACHPCVPLAVITVDTTEKTDYRKSDARKKTRHCAPACEVVNVCNWARDFALTIPNLKYWLEFLFALATQWTRDSRRKLSIKETFARICCTSWLSKFMKRGDDTTADVFGSDAFMRRGMARASAGEPSESGSEASGDGSSRFTDNEKELEALFREAIGFDEQKKSADPRAGFSVLLKKLYADPVVRDAFNTDHFSASPILRAVTAKGSLDPNAPAEENLTNRLAELEQMVAAQQKEIEALKEQR